MFVAPTEPAALRALGIVNMLPERHGVDFLWPCQGSWAGVQRKEIGDLLNSAQDGRLGKELAQMTALVHKWVLIEGTIRFGPDGSLMAGRGFVDWTRAKWEGLLAAIQESGCKITMSADVRDTARVIGVLKKWAAKKRHGSLSTRPGPMSVWGKADSREWQMHFLQGIPGIGPDTAANILDAFGGVPLRWTVGESELKKVKGLGPKKIAAMMEAVRGNT